MEVEVVKAKIRVYGACNSQWGPVYVGRWLRGSALELGSYAYREVDYEWWSHCVADGALYLFGYRGGVATVEPEGLRVAKKTGHIGARGVAYDGKLLYVAGLGGLYVFDRGLRLVGKADAGDLRDVAVAEDGTVYVLGERALYLYDGKLQPVYKLPSGALIGYYVVPYGEDVYVSSLAMLIRLSRGFQERAFTPRMSRSFAVLGDYVVSAYDSTVAIADRDTLSVAERRYMRGLAAGAAKMEVVNNRALAPVYLEDDTAVLSISA